MPLCIQKRAAAGGRGLGYFVLVVREDQVRAAAVDLEVHAQDRLRHGRALDVPARPALAPGRLPERVLALLARLPEREVLRRLLELRRVVALALLHVLERAVRELAVVRERSDAEIDVAARLVGVPALHERLDEGDDLVDRLAGLGLGVGAAEPERLGVVDVGGRHLPGELIARHAPLAGGVVDLVVHVGDVGHEGGLVALVLEEALEQGEHHVGAGVPNVDAPVDGRAAGVDPHPGWVARLERAQLSAQRVVDANLAHRRERLRGACDGGRSWQHCEA
jgi:hypothetical protein